MTRAKSKKTKEKKETYYQRWLRGKKRMLLIMREEEFNAVKQFCDERQMSYREFFTTVAPKLLIENQELKATVEELRKALEEKESRVNDLEAEYNAVAEEYNSLKEAYESLKSEHEAVKNDLAATRADLDQAKRNLEELKAQLDAKDSELKELKGVLEIITDEGRVELPAEYCGRLKKYGFHLEEKEVGGFMKKSTVKVCTNS